MNTNIDPETGGTLSEAEGYRYKFNGMERDDEVSGNHSSYNFGARLYNPRVGRWLSRDPLEAKFANQSPYSFAYDSPILIMDSDGQAGIVTVENGEVVIRSTIYFYNADGSGPKTTQERASGISGNIEKQWNDANGTVTVDGAKYPVRFEITGVALSKNEAYERAQNSEDHESFVGLGDGSQQVNGNEMRNQGSIMPNSSGSGFLNEVRDDPVTSTVPAHEYTHNLGMSGHSDQKAGLIFWDSEKGVKSTEGGIVMIGTQSGCPKPNGELVSTEERQVTQGDIDRLGLIELGVEKLISGESESLLLGTKNNVKIYNYDGTLYSIGSKIQPPGTGASTLDSSDGRSWHPPMTSQEDEPVAGPQEE